MNHFAMANYLIIQGPLSSYGLTGEGWIDRTVGSSQSDLDLIDYSCVKNLIRMSNESVDSNYKIFISTWEANDELKQLNNCEVIRNSEKDIESRVGSVFRENQAKFKQFFSVLTALEKIAGNKNDAVIKIRADMYFPRATIEMMFSQINSNMGYFFVPYMLHNRLITVAEFYVGANFSNFFRLCELICFEKDHNIKRSIHYSIATSLYFNEGKKEIDIELDSLFDPEDLGRPRRPFTRSKLLLNILSFNLNTFKPFPKIVWKQISLRGKNFSSKKIVNTKCFETSQIFQEDIDKGLVISRFFFLLDILVLGRQLHPSSQRLRFMLSRLFFVVLRSTMYERLKAFSIFYKNYLRRL